MAPPLDTRRLVQESAPVAVILLFWVGIAILARPVIETGLLRAGIIMALLYTVVRGLTIAKTQPLTEQPDDVSGILRENVRVALPAGVWFVIAHAIFFVEYIGDTFGLPLSTSWADELAFVFVGAGVAAVLLYAISVGVPRVRATTSTRVDEAAGGTPADD